MDFSQKQTEVFHKIPKNDSQELFEPAKQLAQMLHGMGIFASTFALVHLWPFFTVPVGTYSLHGAFGYLDVPGS